MEEKIIKAMRNIGIILDDIDENTVVGDVLNDSLTFTSFFVELENEFNIQMSEEIFLIDWKNKKLIDLKNILETYVKISK